MELLISPTEIEAILPAGILFLTGLVLLLVDLGGKERADSGMNPKNHLVFIGCAGSVLALMALVTGGGSVVTSLYAGAMSDDAFGRFAGALVTLALLLTTLGAGGYLSSIGQNRGEFYSLLFFGAGAMVLLCQATNLVSIFVAIETLSLSVFVLAGYTTDRRPSSEGAFKYFVLGAFSSGFLLLGMAFLYGVSGGSLALSDIAANGPQVADDILFAVGVLLMVIGFAFKVGAVPFHSWIPDVYQGAPVIAVGWMAVAVKVASFAALLRLLVAAGGGETLSRLIAAIAVVTMLLGNLAALNQTNIKRMLAYSGIAHTGYLLIPLVLGLTGTGFESGSSMLFYLAAYSVTTFAAFAVIATLSRGQDRESIDDLNGLASKHPMIAVVMTLAMLSLAGIPLTAGFVGKLMIFRDAVEGGYIYLALIGIISSVISVYYYLRPVVAMYFREATGDQHEVEHPWGLHLALALAGGAILLLGIDPQALVEFSVESMRSLLGG
ncbi:MAG TPA: NADH-quinone oxidoreductase subunit N [Planctomycetes bacterium]|nr:NADH-quinone oxidoreductase subunit N [Planctomycetota bacterium]HIN80845.1 NADH-quinone oxidoreductase subunit N [Planctomycetota bacterium]